MDTQTKWLCLLALYISVSMVSAIPIEPISGGGTSPTGDTNPVPFQHIPAPPLPSASTAAAVGILFLVLKLKPRFLTDSKTYRIDLNGKRLWLRDNMKRWIESSFSTPREYLEYLRTMVKNSVSDKIPVRNDEGKWVLYPLASVKRYLSMLDSASARIPRLRKRVDIARLRYLSARRIARRRGSTWRIRGAAKYYDRMVAELNAMNSTVRSLNSWSNDLTKLNFDSDPGFKFNGRTFFFSNGILRGISAEEADLRFRRKAKKAYAEFRGSVERIYRELTTKIKSLGWQIVDSSLDTLKSTYNAFRIKLNRLKNEYERERNGRNGSWRRHFKKLYENYYREFRDGSEEIYKNYVESINHRAYVELVPESVKLEIKTKERARMKKRKKMMRWRKRRWCSQLRDRARRYHRSLKKSYKRLYDGELYRNLKKQIDEWRDAALKNAKKLRWQRTLEKAEKRFGEINHFIMDGFYNFREFTNRTVANRVIQEFYGPKKKAEEEAKKQPKKYNKQREDLLAYQSAILHSETQFWIDRWNDQIQVIEIPTTKFISTTTTPTTTNLMPTTCTTIPFSKQNGINLQQNLNDIISAASSTWDRVKEPISWVRDFMKKPYYEGAFDLQNQPVVIRFGDRLKYTEEWCAGIACFEGKENGWIAGAGPQLKLKIKGMGGGLGGEIFIDRSGHNTTIAQSAGVEFGRKNSEFIADYTIPLIQRTFDNETNKTTLSIYNTAIDVMAAATSTSLEKEKILVNSVLLKNATLHPSITFEYPKKGYWIPDQINMTANVTATGIDENGTYRILDYDRKAEIDTPLELKVMEFLIKVLGDAENAIKKYF